jgi:hypothetical protein
LLDFEGVTTDISGALLSYLMDLKSVINYIRKQHVELTDWQVNYPELQFSNRPFLVSAYREGSLQGDWQTWHQP